MSFCQTCGTSLPDGSQTCPACGATQGVPASGAAPGAAPGYTPTPQPPPPPMYAPAPATGTGLTPNVAGALAYLVGAITGILFLVIDPFKSDRFVRFHAFQSIFFNLVWIGFWILWTIVGLMLGAISHGLFFIIQLPINLLITVGGFCIWIYLMYSAYQGKTFQLPVIGPMAASQAGIAPAAQRL
ncbi:MAG TPA: zinc-ribbon domain-containing protein [Acidobacteriaceae bacterium]|nr:zinc-ribbon domain-containing protein [Acidobacteriaceae bacterium]